MSQITGIVSTTGYIPVKNNGPSLLSGKNLLNLSMLLNARKVVANIKEFYELLNNSDYIKSTEKDLSAYNFINYTLKIISNELELAKNSENSLALIFYLHYLNELREMDNSSDFSQVMSTYGSNKDASFSNIAQKTRRRIFDFSLEELNDRRQMLTENIGRNIKDMGRYLKRFVNNSSIKGIHEKLQQDPSCRAQRFRAQLGVTYSPSNTNISIIQTSVESSFKASIHSSNNTANNNSQPQLGNGQLQDLCCNYSSDTNENIVYSNSVLSYGEPLIVNAVYPSRAKSKFNKNKNIENVEDPKKLKSEKNLLENKKQSPTTQRLRMANEDSPNVNKINDGKPNYPSFSLSFSLEQSNNIKEIQLEGNHYSNSASNRILENPSVSGINKKTSNSSIASLFPHSNNRASLLNQSLEVTKSFKATEEQNSQNLNEEEADLFNQILYRLSIPK